MNSTKKIVLTSLSAIVVLFGGALAYFSITDQAVPSPAAPPSEASPAPSPSSSPSPTPAASGAPEATADFTMGEPFAKQAFLQLANGERKEPEEESTIVALMHHMSHQKVKADAKWTSVQMLPDRVETVAQIVEHHPEWEHQKSFWR
ncbi:DUF6241 domain-containing protein [Paenibacillus sp. CC-CFT747]|nr:DUF6241 domain-containing protein [Paenibacillus sp. CC-CFT747]